MKVVGDFNNISKELVPKLPPKGTVVVYHFMIGKPDVNDPRKLIYPSAWQIPTKDRILDSGKNEYIDIGVFDKKEIKDGNENIITKNLWLRAADGHLGLTIGGSDDDELYQFMELTNFNESNPNRDTSKVPMFTRIDAVKDAKDRTKGRSKLTTALVYVENMKEQETRDFAAAMGWGENDDLELLEDQVGEFAKTQPDAFIKFFNDPEIKTKTIVKNALTKGILKHDVTTNKIAWGNGSVVIATLERQEGKTHIDTFTEWLNTTNGGGKIMSAIRKQIADVRRETIESSE